MESTFNVVKEAIPLAKDAVQAVFWITASVIAILTYRGARRTLLQPIRTELFKAQYEAMGPILGLFVGKGEVALRTAAGLQRLFDDNLIALFDQYALTFFDGVDLDMENRPYRACPQKIVALPPELEASKIGQKPFQSDEPPTPEIRAEQWKTRQNELWVNEDSVEITRTLNRMSENPILPIPLVGLLTEYNETLHRIRQALLFFFGEVAAELPEQCPSLDDLNSAPYQTELQNNWVRHNQDDLKPLADQIVDFVRSYFDADSLTRT